MFLLSLLHFLWRYFFTFGAPAPAVDRLAAVAINVALFSAFALHHSFLARGPAKAWVRRVFPGDLERTAYVWTASVLFVLTCALWQPVSGVAWHVTGPLTWLLLAGQLAGVGLTIWSATTLGIWELAGVPLPSRKARPPAPLRSTGVYGLVRHPIYFAWVLLVWSVPVMNGTRLSFAVISTFYLMLAVPFEERALVTTFGPDYVRYQQQVRWRMLPFVY
jgi:protein-S-isoprenylcysteine O-methyltransferase Ste14